MIKPISILLVSVILSAGEITYADAGWKKVHCREDIVVSERWVTYPNGTKTRERKGEFTVKADPYILLSLLIDPKEASQWMKAVSEHKIIGARNKNEWFTYTVYAIPWPFKSQDLVSHYQLAKLPDKGVFRLRISSVDENHVKEVNDGFFMETNLKRLNQYHAEWIIDNKEASICHVRFTASSGTPPPFPRWMMDPVLIRLFSDNLARFRDHAQTGEKDL